MEQEGKEYPKIDRLKGMGGIEVLKARKEE